MANFATGIGNPRFMKRKHQKQADPVIFVTKFLSCSEKEVVRQYCTVHR